MHSTIYLPHASKTIDSLHRPLYFIKKANEQVAVRNASIFRIILSLAVIASLLSQPLVILEEDYALTSYHDAIFEDLFIVNHGGDTDEGFLKTISALFFNMDLFLAEEMLHHRGSPQPSAKPAEIVLLLNEIITPIFIPPKIIS